MSKATPVLDEIHAIRRQINEETKNMTASERKHISTKVLKMLQKKAAIKLFILTRIKPYVVLKRCERHPCR
ncbi:MAG: hypothetical protein FWH46_06280 [Methanimicrococcus sp.]|nr:hypothetical protein [Methanimicrococcus sp.]